MSGRKSSQKGGAFEREISKVLSWWLTKGERDDVFWRSAGSGAKATVTGKVTQAGDLCAVDSLGEPFLSMFIVECKRRRDFGMKGLFYGRDRSPVVIAWMKLLDECWKFDRLPFMVVREDAAPTMLLLDEDGVDLLQGGNRENEFDPPTMVTLFDPDKRGDKVVYITYLDWFLSDVVPGRLKWLNTFS